MSLPPDIRAWAEKVREASGTLADWAEEEVGFESVDVDELRADIIAALDALLIGLDLRREETLREVACTIQARKHEAGISHSHAIGDADDLEPYWKGRADGLAHAERIVRAAMTNPNEPTTTGGQ